VEIFDNINQDGENEDKTIEYYINEVKINDWMILPFKNSIVNFKDRIEYKKNGLYHRLNGPAIEFHKESEKNKYYYKGVLYDDIKLWKKDTLKELRMLKVKKLNKQSD